MKDITLHRGDCRNVLATLPDASIHCVVTSPPYFGLRAYDVKPTFWGGDSECDHSLGRKIRSSQRIRGGKGGTLTGGKGVECLHPSMGSFCTKCNAWHGALGLEPDPNLYVAHLVDIFREVRRVLRADGTCWVVIGDSYAPSGGDLSKERSMNVNVSARGSMRPKVRKPPKGSKAKNLFGIPWRFAFAMQDHGWYLRQEIIWAKPNSLPESVKDRCTRGHENVFMFTKRASYYYDADAIKEPTVEEAHARFADPSTHAYSKEALVPGSSPHTGLHKCRPRRSGNKRRKCGAEIDHINTTRGESDPRTDDGFRNKRSVWHVNVSHGMDGHHATFPEALVEPMVLAGCPPDGVVLDLFAGTGTTGVVAVRCGRKFIGIDISDAYFKTMRKQLTVPKPLYPVHESSHRVCPRCGGGRFIS